MGLAVDREGYLAAWDEVMAPVLDRQRPGVTVLRDYHAENIMLLDPAPDGSGPQGLIDFQDALVGHPAYDLVSLLQDARRDVAPELERAMIERYVAAAGPGMASRPTTPGSARSATRRSSAFSPACGSATARRGTSP